MEIIAHRGASFYAPENTLSSFRLGFQQRADAAELDVHLTRDGRVVAVHDPDTRRTAGVTHRVVEHTFEELRKLEVGQWGRWKGRGFCEKIPALEEVLELVPKGKRLFIEIKCGPEVLPALENIFHHSHVLIGFDYDILKAAKVRFPRHPVYWAVETDTAGKGFPPVRELIAKAKTANFNGLDLEKRFPIDRAFVEAVHQAGLKLYTWTVDELKTARAEAAAGVDGITTNRPAWLGEHLAK
jgi:glycerophosphoryl diester phosphodiesterase